MPARNAFAGRYAAILARNGITLEIRTSAGSLENLDRLEKDEAQVGFVQGGLLAREIAAQRVEVAGRLLGALALTGGLTALLAGLALEAGHAALRQVVGLAGAGVGLRLAVELSAQGDELGAQDVALVARGVAVLARLVEGAAGLGESGLEVGEGCVGRCVSGQPTICGGLGAG